MVKVTVDPAIELGPFPGSCMGEYTLIRNWTVTDLCGNDTVHEQTITVQDLTNPSLDMMASDSTVECDGMGNMTELNDWLANNGGATASDACSGVTWSNDYDALTIAARQDPR